MTAMPAWVDAAIKPLDSDPKDMSWLLVNAKLSWKRSGPGETVTWVRQAADLARQQGDHARASGLAAAAKEIEKRVPTANSGLPRRALAETGRYVVTPDAPTQMGDLDDGLVAQTVPPEPKSQPPDLEKARHKPVRPDIPITARDGEEGTLVMTPAPERVTS